MIEADSVRASFTPASGSKKSEIRMEFSHDGRMYSGEAQTRVGYPCTDLRLRRWGRRFRQPRNLSDVQMRSVLGYERVFVVLGLAREFRGKCWPMVVGFHTYPDYVAEIDLTNP
jgi:hypothetical protein